MLHLLLFCFNPRLTHKIQTKTGKPYTSCPIQLNHKVPRKIVADDFLFFLFSVFFYNIFFSEKVRLDKQLSSFLWKIPKTKRKYNLLGSCDWRVKMKPNGAKIRLSLSARKCDFAALYPAQTAKPHCLIWVFAIRIFPKCSDTRNPD